MEWNTYLGIFCCLQIVKLSHQEPCTHTFDLKPNVTYTFSSPNYPDKYRESTCRYKFVAPQDQGVLAECIYDIDKNGDKCDIGTLYISRVGDLSLQDSGSGCGRGKSRRSSIFRSMVIAYESTATNTSEMGGSFSCNLTVEPQSCECGWSQSSRIVGGENARVGEFPSMVAIWDIKEEIPFCGGTIISHRFVATADHCVKKQENIYLNKFATVEEKELYVVAGFTDVRSLKSSPYAVYHKVEEIISYKKYEERTYDIALLKTATEIEWSRGVGPACLPFHQENNTFVNDNVTVTGWGFNSTHHRQRILQKVVLKVISSANCSKIWRFTTPSDICTLGDGKDSCAYDSGGPVYYLATQQYLVGIVGGGSVKCGDQPAYNTRVTDFIDWILQNSGADFCYKSLQ